MPASSKAQWRYMKAVASGKARNKSKGLSRAEAAEYVAGQSPMSLPERAPKKLSGQARRMRSA